MGSNVSVTDDGGTILQVFSEIDRGNFVQQIEDTVKETVEKVALHQKKGRTCRTTQDERLECV